MSSKSSPTYYEQLKHPEWQRKRLTIMDRAEFRCESCGTDQLTLNVHHSYYEKGRKPWEYPDESLRCLCEECHRRTHDEMDLLKRQLGKVPLGDLTQVLGYAAGMEAKESSTTIIEVLNYDHAL